MRGLATICALMLGGCFLDTGSGSECSVDSQCLSGESCTRTGECFLTSSLVKVRINWTINGQTVTPTNAAACSAAGIDHMAIKFVDDFGDGLTYSPTPCNLGTIAYDKMPSYMVSVSLIARTASSRWLDDDTRSIQIGENTVDMNLSP